MRRLCLSVLIGVIAAGSMSAGQERPPLRDVPEIDEGLYTIGLAHEIRKNCPQISARMLVAISKVRGLHQLAQGMGYTRAEMEAHLDSDAEKDRLRARARAYFDEKGLATDTAGYCALGEMEIAAGTDVGRLLRMTN